MKKKPTFNPNADTLNISQQPQLLPDIEKKLKEAQKQQQKQKVFTSRMIVENNRAVSGFLETYSSGSSNKKKLTDAFAENWDLDSLEKEFPKLYHVRNILVNCYEKLEPGKKPFEKIVRGNTLSIETFTNAAKLEHLLLGFIPEKDYGQIAVYNMAGHGMNYACFARVEGERHNLDRDPKIDFMLGDFLRAHSINTSDSGDKTRLRALATKAYINSIENLGDNEENREIKRQVLSRIRGFYGNSSGKGQFDLNFSDELALANEGVEISDISKGSVVYRLIQ